MNNEFREYVTSGARFALTLNKAQIKQLVLRHHCGNFRNYLDSRHARGDRDPHFITTSQSLYRRGLVADGQKLTPAGLLVIGLLKECGIYQSRLAEEGFEEPIT